jgi:hypothetical protein
MKLRIPSKGVLERLRLAYELEGAQKGVDVLTRYYRIPRMKIRVDARGFRKYDQAWYQSGRARFRKRSVKKRIVLHELAHHLISYKGLEMRRKEEERLCDRFADEILVEARMS